MERELMDAPGTRTEARMVIEELSRSRHQRLMTWQRDQERWPAAWRDATMIANSRLNLTLEQTAALTTRLLEVVDEFRAQQHDIGTPDTVRVMVLNDVFPTGPPPDGTPDDAGE